jgi:glycosyltransferase involved in cell wall biosynthesis
MAPFLSIIIPTYNSHAVVQLALDSIRQQDFQDYEIIIVDGSSKDNTLGIIKSNQLRDPRIFFVSEVDKGIYDAMNKGIDLARGNWLYFLGSDDRLVGNNVLSQIQSYLLKTSSNLVYGNVILGSKAYDGAFDFEKLLLRNISHQAAFYKRSIFNAVGYYNIEYKMHADWDFNLRAFLYPENRAEYVPITVANFATGGISGGHDKKFLVDRLLPATLTFLDSNPKKIHSLVFYDNFWRLVRNSEIKIQHLKEILQSNTPKSQVLTDVVLFQNKVPRRILQFGLASKLLMFVSYLRHKFTPGK